MMSTSSLQLSDWIKRTSRTRIAGPELLFDFDMTLAAFDSIS